MVGRLASGACLANDESLVNIAVVSLDEARRLAHQYGAVITAGPKADAADFGHPMQRVRTFLDTTSGPMSPTVSAVRSLVEFGAGRTDSLLIHCHRGESRSPAIAIGIAVATGMSVDDACQAVQHWVPDGRKVRPNSLIVQHLEQVLGVVGLVAEVCRWFPTVAVGAGAGTTRAW